MSEKKVEWNEITGIPSTILESLNRSLGQYIGRYKTVKVGITGRDPQQRFNEHLKEIDWDRMVVIYESSSINFCNEIEASLVANKFDCLSNKRAGGGSDLSEKGLNYVYVLLKGLKIKKFNGILNK
jgi:hypothetical protein